MKRDICVVGVLVDERSCHAPEVQEVFTKYGSHILCRNGIPDPGRERGIITLTMQAREDERGSLEKELSSIEGVKVRSLCLSEAIE
jgi:putative iron-only hydrogenase system regulator